MADGPNILIVMTDEERYPPPYESAEVAEFRRTHMPTRHRLAQDGVSFHRHYAGSTACLPSRATLFTGQYPSLHGVRSTDGVAKRATDEAMGWLDPNTVPTMGDWFRAAGYGTHYRGKWHISHADLLIPGTHESLKASDENGVLDPSAVDAYRRADRLDPFGFSGWIGREPHGGDKADCGTVRDGTFAEQVVELFHELSGARSDGPWLAVASFVNPHDIIFGGGLWTDLLEFAPPDESVPAIPAAPSQGDSFAGRPPCQEQWAAKWPEITFPMEADGEYRRLYYHLHRLVDRAIGRVVDALHDSGMADDTIVLFTSDHGDLLGAHGGLLQKWYNAYDEAVRVPLTLTGPGVARRDAGVTIPTSHVDVLPTLLGLAGVDRAVAAEVVSRHHVEVQPLPGRDLSGLVRGEADASAYEAPVYFMTEDHFSSGSTQVNFFTGAHFEAVEHPAHIEAVVARLPTGPGGAPELWKLNHYYERLDEWNADHGIAANPFAGPAAEPLWELHNLTTDPEERTNRASDATAPLGALQALLLAQRDEKRRLPCLRN